MNKFINYFSQKEEYYKKRISELTNAKNKEGINNKYNSKLLSYLNYCNTEEDNKKIKQETLQPIKIKYTNHNNFNNTKNTISGNSLDYSKQYLLTDFNSENTITKKVSINNSNNNNIMSSLSPILSKKKFHKSRVTKNKFISIQDFSLEIVNENTKSSIHALDQNKIPEIKLKEDRIININKSEDNSILENYLLNPIGKKKNIHNKYKSIFDENSKNSFSGCLEIRKQVLLNNNPAINKDKRTISQVYNCSIDSKYKKF
jgi:hypothetical protein